MVSKDIICQIQVVDSRIPLLHLTKTENSQERYLQANKNYASGFGSVRSWILEKGHPRQFMWGGKEKFQHWQSAQSSYCQTKMRVGRKQ